MSFPYRTALRTLIDNLPRYAEEGNLFTTVKKSDLQSHLTDAGLTTDAATLLLDIVERLLSSVATLETQALQQGEWRFVSFPAQLFANSLLHTLADDQQLLLNSHFWESPQHDNELQKQFSYLHWLETHRTDYHRQKAAQPIRFIYVAWVLIKLEGQFLLHRREDSKIRDGKGEYVLIGGRTNARDFENVVENTTNADRLRLLQNPPAELLPKILENTLKREVEEETGLLYAQDYTVTPWRTLKTYYDVAGAKANHAYTEYHLSLFNLNLTQQGFFRLLEKEQEKPALFKRFTLDEIVFGHTLDGETAYLDALYKDFHDKDALKEALANLTDSISPDYRFDDDITLPLKADEPIKKGPTGKEQPLHFILDLNQYHLLWALAAHAKGLDFIPVNESVTLLGYGWIKVTDESLAKQLKELANTLKDNDYPLVEIKPAGYFRLSVEPSRLFFDARNFVYCFKSLSNNSIWCELILLMNSVKTALGVVKSRREPPVRLKTWVRDKLLKTPDNYDESLYDNVRTGIERKVKSNQIGLRKFMRRSDKRHQDYEITCEFDQTICEG